MAIGLDKFADFLSNVGEFRFTSRYYEPETDALIFYFRDEGSYTYSKRITRSFTVFLSFDDDSLVGFEVKGIKTLINQGSGEVKPVEATRN